MNSERERERVEYLVGEKAEGVGFRREEAEREVRGMREGCGFGGGVRRRKRKRRGD